MVAVRFEKEEETFISSPFCSISQAWHLKVDRSVDNTLGVYLVERGTKDEEQGPNPNAMNFTSVLVKIEL